jgi:hypothetical protein
LLFSNAHEIGYMTPFSAYRTAPQAGHLCRNARFINKDQTTGIKIQLGVKPTFALCLYVWTLHSLACAVFFETHIVTGEKAINKAF